jgi:hypothetical protein
VVRFERPEYLFEHCDGVFDFVLRRGAAVACLPVDEPLPDDR